MLNKIKKIEWKTQKKPYPQFVSQNHIDIWNKQKSYITQNIGLQEHLHAIEWPSYLNNTEQPKSTSGELLTNWEKNPLLRDNISPIELDIPTIWVKKESLIHVMAFLKTDPLMSYTYLLDLTAVDFLNSPDKTDIEKNQGKRFRMVLFITSNARL